jgi:hypothetical protein
MLDDFHYYCTAVIARAAGFSKKESLRMAFASQYLDDAAEHKPVHVDNLLFDPVRTAYMGIRSVNWSIQKRVFIPFHFLPEKPLRDPEDTFVVRPNSPFARVLLAQAAAERKRRFRIIRLGIAIHTFADTWAHQGFSGRHSHENCVSRTETWENGRWNYNVLKNVFIKFAPHIGHAEAGLYPDIPYLKWRYEAKHGDGLITRDNPQIYLEAAREIYHFLRTVLPPHRFSRADWREIEGKILEQLSSAEKDMEKRCENWRNEFGKWFEPRAFFYDKYEWRKKALLTEESLTEDWHSEVALEAEGFEKTFLLKKNFYKSDWVLFHRAAMKQRHFVLENLL